MCHLRVDVCECHDNEDVKYAQQLMSGTSQQGSIELRAVDRQTTQNMCPSSMSSTFSKLFGMYLARLFQNGGRFDEAAKIPLITNGSENVGKEAPHLSHPRTAIN
ncbi:unnamed protein product [Caenorhabditis auriculariae]|uniref:Uncharacterized protein n=1 Tax=Caenorhabditis auriculariae TaxID=2777116 RepID=A0A8S1GTG5_9PELO|nr:unnamed protein product [Caenorhabditis auriculariae]